MSYDPDAGEQNEISNRRRLREQQEAEARKLEEASIGAHAHAEDLQADPQVPQATTVPRAEPPKAEEPKQEAEEPKAEEPKEEVSKGESTRGEPVKAEPPKQPAEKPQGGQKQPQQPAKGKG
jgi:hypothetical protein